MSLSPLTSIALTPGADPIRLAHRATHDARFCIAAAARVKSLIISGYLGVALSGCTEAITPEITKRSNNVTKHGLSLQYVPPIFGGRCDIRKRCIQSFTLEELLFSNR